MNHVQPQSSDHAAELAQRQPRPFRDPVKLQHYFFASPRTVSVTGCKSLGAVFSNLQLDFVFNLREEVAEIEDIEHGAEVGEDEDEVGVGDWEGLRAGGRDVSMEGLELGV